MQAVTKHIEEFSHFQRKWPIWEVPPAAYKLAWITKAFFDIIAIPFWQRYKFPYLHSKEE